MTLLGGYNVLDEQMSHVQPLSFFVALTFDRKHAVPFEEDDKDSSIWFLDHNYHESMFSMFRRINGNFSRNHLLFYLFGW